MILLVLERLSLNAEALQTTVILHRRDVSHIHR
jgi:hypothetical protein